MLKLFFVLVALQLVASQTVTPVTSGQTITVNSGAGLMTYFSIPVAANQEIDITTAVSGSSAEFYFRSGQLPTTSVYSDYESVSSGNNRLKVFSCFITDNNLAGTMYFAFRPYNTVSNAQFTVTIRDQLCITPLSVNGTLPTTQMGPGEFRYYYFDVTTENQNQNTLRFRAQVIQGSTSYNGIYWNKDIRPTNSLHNDYWSVSSDRTIELNCLSVGRHYIAMANEATAWKQFAGSFENRLRPCALPITSGFSEIYDPLYQTWQYYVIDVADNNFLNINVKEITADYVEIYVQRDRFPTTSDYLDSYTGSTNNKFLSLGPCTVTAGKYYIALWGGSGGQMQITVNTVPHKCITPITSAFTETLVIHSGHWLYYTYDVSANQNQYVVLLSRQVTGSTSTYVQYDAQPTSSYYALYNGNSGTQSLPLTPCDIQEVSTVYFAVRSYADQSSVALSLVASNSTCPIELSSNVPYQALSFWSGDNYWTTTSRFTFEVTQNMTPMAIRLSVTSQASQAMYLAFNREPTTSTYDYYSYSTINVPLDSFAVGKWYVIVKGSAKPFTITANFDSSAPVTVPSSSAGPASNDVCGTYDSCSSCTSVGGCGWCSYSDTCLRGSVYGSSSYCPSDYWSYDSCPIAPVTCSATSCGDCFGQTGCVWCVTSTSCVPQLSANSTCLRGHYTEASQCTAAGKVSDAVQFNSVKLLVSLLVTIIALWM